MQGDRLEPNSELPDVSFFESLDSFPTLVLFWRVSQETLTRHRNPIFCQALGIGISSLCIDTLHTLHLGVIKRFCMWGIWFFMEVDLFGVGGSGDYNEDEKLQLNANALRHELWGWYELRLADHPQEDLSRLQDLQPSMLGTKNAPALKTKAAETLGLLYFLRDTIEKICREAWGEGLSSRTSCEFTVPPYGHYVREPEAIISYQHPGAVPSRNRGAAIIK